MTNLNQKLNPALIISLFVANCLALTNLAAATISGEVSGNNGPEAGAWVSAETDELDTNFIKIAVTDSDSKFLLPELPEVNYRVWVRGYGLKDSNTVQAETGA